MNEIDALAIDRRARALRAAAMRFALTALSARLRQAFARPARA